MQTQQITNVNELPAISGNQELGKFVVSELSLLQHLNIEQVTLDALRHSAGFPVIYLNNRNRVYWLSDVRAWLEGRRRNSQPATAKASEG